MEIQRKTPKLACIFQGKSLFLPQNLSQIDENAHENQRKIIQNPRNFRGKPHCLPRNMVQFAENLVEIQGKTPKFSCIF